MLVGFGKGTLAIEENNYIYSRKGDCFFFFPIHISTEISGSIQLQQNYLNNTQIFQTMMDHILESITVSSQLGCHLNCQCPLFFEYHNQAQLVSKKKYFYSTSCCQLLQYCLSLLDFELHQQETLNMLDIVKCLFNYSVVTFVPAFILLVLVIF